jgi:DNA-directed RNA polymerase specialized sigma24 family protein
MRNFNGNGPALSRDVVTSAVAGNQSAWNQIVDAYAGLVWAVPRRHQLDRQEAAYVSQLTWMRLSDRLGDIAPEALGTWLERTAERESKRVLRLALVVEENEAQPA